MHSVFTKDNKYKNEHYLCKPHSNFISSLKMINDDSFKKFDQQYSDFIRNLFEHEIKPV